MSDGSHDELVRRAVKWLVNSKGCNPVYAEQTSVAAGESPDAIGWTCRGSILIECKVSMQDLYADKRKWFRKAPERGMGRWRYYMTMPGMIVNHALLPSKWGLLEVNEKTVRTIVEAQQHNEWGMDQEILLLRSAIMSTSVNRASHSDAPGTTVYVTDSEEEADDE